MRSFLTTCRRFFMMFMIFDGITGMKEISFTIFPLLGARTRDPIDYFRRVGKQ